FGVTTGQGYLAAIDQQVLYLSPYLERVSISDYDIGYLALLDRSDLVSHPEDLSRIDRHCLECFFLWKTKRSSHSCVIGKISSVCRVERLKGNSDARFGQYPRIRERSVVRVILVLRQTKDGSYQHWNTLGFQEVGNPVSFGTAGKNHF